MIKRIVEIGSPAHLSLRRKQLVIEPKEGEKATVPIEDLGVLVLDHPQITHSQAILAGCAAMNVAVVFSNGKHLPEALLLPLSGHTLHSRTVDLQAKVSAPVKKRMWKAIIRAKIRGQGRLAALLTGEAVTFDTYCRKVRSGDPENIEGQVARLYWSRLFGDAFRRDRELPGINALLNYGYAIARAAVARAIVGTGLHPALGLHHRGQYNSYCLADDLMEPVRPLVDWVAWGIVRSVGDDQELTRETKEPFLALLSRPVRVQAQPLPLMVALQHYAASAKRMICGEDDRFDIPEFLESVDRPYELKSTG